MSSRNAERGRPDGAEGSETPERQEDPNESAVGADEPDRDEDGPITNPHHANPGTPEPQEPRELENPPQERGPRERQNNAV